MRNILLILMLLTPSLAISEEAVSIPSDVSPEADAHLRAMSDYLATLKAFSFNAREMLDILHDEGHKVQYSNIRSAVVRKPDRFYGKSVGDIVNRETWYNAGKLTVFNPSENVYARADVPKTIGKAIDYLAKEKGLVMPLAELFYDDVHQAVTIHVEWGAYLGEHNVGEKACHHLIFGQPGISWQLWIEAGQRPIPAKLVITYESEPAQPQYVGIIEQWNSSPEAPDNLFEPRLPSDAESIEILESDNVHNQHGEKKQ